MTKRKQPKGLEAILGRKRACMVLLHPVSLPDPEGATYGIGELGSEAYRFADFLAEAGAAVWQTLPLGHTGYGDSPYQTFSRFAGSPYMISVEKLLGAGDITREQHDGYCRAVRDAGLSRARTDFGFLFKHKLGTGWQDSGAILRQAFASFSKRGEGDPRRAAFEAFRRKYETEFAGWLRDYAEYMAIKEHQGHGAWPRWPEEFRDAHAWRSRRPDLLSRNPDLGKSIAFFEYLQFVFFEQWDALREHVRRRGRVFLGDLPWYVGYDSADVWANREVFELDAHGTPLAVAGVPPDYFSPTGQLWGNPLYDWSKPGTFDWWINAISFLLSKVDLLRLDHFRAIDTYWKIPWDWAARERTAVRGVWAKAPGHALLEALHRKLHADGRELSGGQLPIVAEDLGFLDPLYATPEAYPQHWNPAQKFAVEASFRKLLEEERRHHGDAGHAAAQHAPEHHPADGRAAHDSHGKGRRKPRLGAAFNRETGEYSTRKGVDILLEAFSLPRMEVLQFILEGGGPDSVKKVGEECVMYTGTHDNDTALGWYRAQALRGITEALAARRPLSEFRDPLGRAIELGRITMLRDAPWEMIEMVFGAASALAAIPMQDLLDLGSEARMNTPGDNLGGWWTWRATPGESDYAGIARRLKALADAVGRTV